MFTYLLKRISMTDLGTFGVLINDQNHPVMLTVELPWKDNQHNVSCIPAGTYAVKRVTTPKHGECFEVQNVPGRDSILIHKANTVRDLLGCIGVGEEFGVVSGLPGVLDSGVAYDALMEALEDVDQWNLRIVEV